MADPLLTTLCAICHINTPRYKCPRCTMRTCSVSCVKKHRAWSDCTGARDATTYVVPSRLRTPAGVDHDYNFLHSVERGVERAERIVSQDKGIFADGELDAARAKGNLTKRVVWKTGRDGTKRKVVEYREKRRERIQGRMLERFLKQKLRKTNTTVEFAPTGLSRQRENTTTLNRRTARVNWQVEWLTVVEGEACPVKVERRMLAKTMDDLPMWLAYRDAKLASKYPMRPQLWERDQASQNEKATWTMGPETRQEADGSWNTLPDPWADEARFFLGRPHQQASHPTVVSALQGGECLREILTDVRVLEFPTIYILQAGQDFPRGMALGPKDIVPRQQQGQKRKGGFGVEEPLDVKRRKGEEDGDESEEGEVVMVEEFDEDDQTSSSGSDTSEDGSEEDGEVPV